MDHKELMLMNFVPSKENQTIQSHITIEDVSQVFKPQLSLTDYEPKYNGDVIAWGRAVYETQPQESVDADIRLAVELSRKYAPGNLWVLPTHERLPYPYAVYWPLCNAFQTEKNSGRRFDWFIWIDDDAIVTIKDWNAIMEVANPVDRPFVAALGYDRLPHHRPAVSEVIGGEQRMWLTAPKSGTYPVLTTGLVFAVFHRSLFEKVPEPWFGVSAPMKGSSGVAPDWWWSYRLHAAGITPHVCCDTNVIHMGRKLHINRAYSEKYTKMCDEQDLFKSDYIKQENRIVSEVTGAITIPVADVVDGRQENE